MAREAKTPTAPADVAAALPGDWNDDMELFEAIVAMDAGDPRAIGPVMAKLAGEEGAAAVRESLRGEDGVIRITALRQWAYDVIGAANGKNS